MKSAALGFLFLCCLIPGFSQKPSEQLLLDLYEKESFNLVVSRADSLLNLEGLDNYSRIHQIKADALYFLNDVPKSLNHYLEAIRLHEQYPLTTFQVLECYSHAGFCYKYLGKYLEAIPYYDKAYNIAISISDSVEIANQSSNLGTLYSQLGNYSKSLEYFNTAYQIDFILNDTVALAYDLVNLGGLKLTIGDTEAAIDYYKEGLKVKETIAGDHTTHILRIGKLSHAYLIAGNLDSAKVYNKLAIEQAAEIGDSLSLNKQLIIQAGIYNAEKKYDNAMQVASKAYSYFNNGDNSYQVISVFELVDAYKGKQQFQRAIALLNDALDISLGNNLLEQTSTIYEKRANLYEQLGNKTAALADYKKFQSVKDTLQQLDKQNAILILDQEYQTSQKQQQIELLEAREQVTQLELAEKRKDNIVLTFLLVLIVAVSVYIYSSVRRKNQLKNSLLTSEINELRLQIKAVMEGSPEDMKLEIETLNSSIEEPLSEREFEILNFAISELTNTEIAEKTFVSVNTVKYHLKNVYSKLGVTNRREALKFAFQKASN